MAIPVTTNTVVGGPRALTLADPEQGVVCTDTTSYTPAMTAREWQVNGTPVPLATASPVTIEFIKAGVYPVRARGTNADGAANATAVNVTVTEPAALPYVTGEFASRVHPENLPREFRDPTLATPGLPTTQALVTARILGSVLPTASQPNVLFNGVLHKIA